MVFTNNNLFFDLAFPDTGYPFKHPSALFRSTDHVTRFQPNLYVDGKVCLSVLNTWRGDQWTACQTISSVLLVLVTILNENTFLLNHNVICLHRFYSW